MHDGRIESLTLTAARCAAVEQIHSWKPEDPRRRDGVRRPVHIGHTAPIHKSHSLN